MNAAYIAIGALFIVLGAGALGRAKSTTEARAATGNRLSGALFIFAGLFFVGAGILAGK